MVAFWLEVNHSFRDASSPFYLRYLTLVPATLIIYAGPLFNVINVSSACSTNTDNFLSLQSRANICIEKLRILTADPIPFLASGGCGPVISFGNVFSLWMDPALVMSQEQWIFSSQLYLLPVTQRKCQKGSDWFSFVGGGVGGLYWWFARNPIPEISVGRIAQEH